MSGHSTIPELEHIFTSVYFLLVVFYTLKFCLFEGLCCEDTLLLESNAYALKIKLGNTFSGNKRFNNEHKHLVTYCSRNI